MTQDPIRSLYESSQYPALSYPSCDPAVMAVAAKMAGLDCPPPSCSRILEIGCSSGHHLLHLAARWPDSRFIGIDLSSNAIREARAAASAAGLENIDFHDVPLEDFDPGDERYDFIIAHGFYSWVPPVVKDSLMIRMPSLLGETGIAAIGYNTLPGWALRRPIGEILIKWAGLPEARDISTDRMIEQLEGACPSDSYGVHMRAILHHMRTHGASTLPFDELAECNTPCTFTDFAHHAHHSGLRYLGEADFAQNLPANLGDDALSAFSPLASDSLGFQQALDVFSGRSHRVSLVCAAGAPVEPRISTATSLDFAIRTDYKVRRDATGVSLHHSSRPDVRLSHPLAASLFEVLSETAPRCLAMSDLLERLGPSTDLPTLAGLLMEFMRRGLAMARIEPVDFSPVVPDRPCLAPIRLHSVRHGRSLVDIYHTPLVFSETEYELLAAMDGTRSTAELERLSAPMRSGPEFHQWLAALTRHGVFEGCC
jgi:SAM-dependent methyltransferase